jgi:hypothetical protein
MMRDTDRLGGAGCVGRNGTKVGQPIWETEEAVQDATVTLRRGI